MANTAAYRGLRWGELTALTIPQVDRAARVITVDRKVVEVAGHLYIEKRRRTASSAGRSTPAARPPATRSPSGSPPGSSKPAPSRPSASTRSGWSSPRRRVSTGGPPTSTATSSSAPTAQSGDATPRAAAGGPGTACGTCSVPPPCSPGSSTPPTCPAWPGTPITASHSTCTSAPPPASLTAHERPPSNHARPC